jgi:hypothetical protein
MSNSPCPLERAIEELAMSDTTPDLTRIMAAYAAFRTENNKKLDAIITTLEDVQGQLAELKEIGKKVRKCYFCASPDHYAGRCDKYRSITEKTVRAVETGQL